NMSHEIRTPMNAIIGLTHLAVTQIQEPKLHSQLSKVEDSAKALLGLLNDILDFSKIEAGRMTVERIPFDLWDVLDRVQGLISDRASEKSLMFNVWRVPHLPRDLMGDPLRLHQVLLNLVSNAVKFTNSGSVTLNCTVVEASDTHASLRFEVQDTGIGIDPIQMTRLFSAFTQADNSTTRRFGGTGLGLTICKELVALMGGRLTVDSTHGSGSTFTVLLDFDCADPAWRQLHLPDDDLSQGDPLVGAKVLLVDDNFINLEVAGELLRQSQVEVTTATNGREALEKIMASDYDAVLMDLQMPEMDGLTATRQLRLDPLYANLPVIAMTANAMTGDRERCIAAGMNDHIPKPIDPVEMRTTLARWLRRRLTGDLDSTIPPPKPLA
ncbi:MAG: ATP-binding protein, partial [Pseudomonadota bacterium]